MGVRRLLARVGYPVQRRRHLPARRAREGGGHEHAVPDACLPPEAAVRLPRLSPPPRAAPAGLRRPLLPRLTIRTLQLLSEPTEAPPCKLFIPLPLLYIQYTVNRLVKCERRVTNYSDATLNLS